MIDINDEFTLQHKRIYADKNKKKLKRKMNL